MAKSLTLEELIEAANKLNLADRQRMLHVLTVPSAKQSPRIAGLRSLGKEIWRGCDAQEYVNSERDSWES
jgi:hypothetical protein